jgi:Caspase domain
MVNLPPIATVATVRVSRHRVVSWGTEIIPRAGGSLSREDLKPPPYLTVEDRGEAYVLSARSGAELSKLRIFVDGQTFRDVDIHGNSFTLSISTRSIPEGRWLNFVVEDKQKMRSAIRAFRLGNRRYAGRLNVVAVGADQFRRATYMDHAVPDLMFARSDAARFERNIRRYLSPFYSSYNATSIVGDRPTAEEVIRAIGNAAKSTGKDDTLVLFLASHGTDSNGGFSILLPPAIGKSEVEEVPFEKISAAVGEASGRVIVFLDACHSADAAQDAGSEKLASIGGNITIIAASKGRQSSLENASWDGGIFTTAIVDELLQLSRPPARDESAKVLTIERLYANIRKTVTGQTNGQQTPWLRRSGWRGEQSIN